MACLEDPDTIVFSDCQIIKWGQYTYWVYRHTDNRTWMTIVAYDADDTVVDQ